MSFKVVLLSDNARVPTRATCQAAGYDLYSACDLRIRAKSLCLVPLDIKVSLPADTYGRIAPRSSLAMRHFIDVGAGVIDSDYRGPLSVVLFNHGRDTFEVKKGDRIAQLIIENISTPPIEIVDSLEPTVRNENGFGSTGH